MIWAFVSSARKEYHLGRGAKACGQWAGEPLALAQTCRLHAAVHSGTSLQRCPMLSWALLGPGECLFIFQDQHPAESLLTAGWGRPPLIMAPAVTNTQPCLTLHPCQWNDLSTSLRVCRTGHFHCWELPKGRSVCPNVNTDLAHSRCSVLCVEPSNQATNCSSRELAGLDTELFSRLHFLGPSPLLPDL